MSQTGRERRGREGERERDREFDRERQKRDGGRDGETEKEIGVLERVYSLSTSRLPVLRARA